MSEPRPFELKAEYEPAGDQPAAIAALIDGIQSGLAHQTLLGVTGSGKTYSIANVIQAIQRPTLVLVHNKTLAAQLYGEFKTYFPRNSVEYFVSYYDYYQPEAYVPSSDTYIEKDASINEHIEQMRLSATKALLERPDSIIVATVSAIYGLGDPESYLKMVLHLVRGDRMDHRQLLRRLADMQYTRNELDLRQGTFRVRGDVVDIFPAESERDAVRVQFFDEEIESLAFFDPLTGEVLRKVPRLTVFPSTHYVTPRERLLAAVDEIKVELRSRLAELRAANKLVEAQRLEQRTLFDLEMIAELGYCAGIENYSRYLSGRQPGEPPPCLFDYLPRNSLLVVDESHVTVPAAAAACTAAIARARRHSSNTGSGCPRRSTTGRFASTSSSASSRRRSMYRQLRQSASSQSPARSSSRSCARPDSWTRASRCGLSQLRLMTCYPRYGSGSSARSASS